MTLIGIATARANGPSLNTPTLFKSDGMSVADHFESDRVRSSPDRRTTTLGVTPDTSRFATNIAHGWGTGIASKLFFSEDSRELAEALFQDRQEQRDHEGFMNSALDLTANLASGLIGSGDPIEAALFIGIAGGMSKLVSGGMQLGNALALANGKTSFAWRAAAKNFSLGQRSTIVRALHSATRGAVVLGPTSGIVGLFAEEVKQEGLSTDEAIDIFFSHLKGGAIAGAVLGGGGSLIKSVGGGGFNRLVDKYAGSRGPKTGDIPDADNPQFTKQKPQTGDLDPEGAQAHKESFEEMVSTQEIRDIREQDLNAQIQDTDSVSADSIYHPERQRWDTISEPFVYTDTEGNIFTDGELLYPKEHPTARVFKKGEMPVVDNYLEGRGPKPVFASPTYNIDLKLQAAQRILAEFPQEGEMDVAQVIKITKLQKKAAKAEPAKIRARQSVQEVENSLKVVTSIEDVESSTYTEAARENVRGQLGAVALEIDEAVSSIKELKVDEPMHDGHTTAQTIFRLRRAMREIEGDLDPVLDYFNVDKKPILEAIAKADAYLDGEPSIFMPDGVKLDENKEFDVRASVKSSDLGLSFTYDGATGREQINLQQRGLWERTLGDEGTVVGNRMSKVIQEIQEEHIEDHAKKATSQEGWFNNTMRYIVNTLDKGRAYRGTFQIALNDALRNYPKQAAKLRKDPKAHEELFMYLQKKGSLKDDGMRALADAVSDSYLKQYDAQMDIGRNLGFISGYHGNQRFDAALLRRTLTPEAFVEFMDERALVLHLERERGLLLKSGKDKGEVDPAIEKRYNVYWKTLYQNNINSEGITVFDSSNKGSVDYLNGTGQRVIQYKTGKGEYEAMIKLTHHKDALSMVSRNAEVTGERIALHENFGSNPRATADKIKEVYLKHVKDLPKWDTSKGRKGYFGRLHDILTGGEGTEKTLQMARSTFAFMEDVDYSIFAVQQMLNKLTHRYTYFDDGGRWFDWYHGYSRFAKQLKLGSSGRYYIDDMFRSIAVSRDAGGTVRDMGKMFTEYAPGFGKMTKADIAHLGMQFQDTRAVFEGEAGMTIAENFFHAIATQLRHVTFTDKLTARAKLIMGKEWYRHVGTHIDKPYNTIPRNFKNHLDRAGLNSAEWDLLRSLPYTVDIAGVRYYSPRDIYRLKSAAARQAATKLNGGMHNFIAEGVIEANALAAAGTKLRLPVSHSDDDIVRAKGTAMDVLQNQFSLFAGSARTLGFYLSTSPNPLQRAWKELLWTWLNGFMITSTNDLLRGRPALPNLETPADVFLYIARLSKAGGARGLLSEKGLSTIIELSEAVRNNSDFVDAVMKQEKDLTSFSGLNLSTKTAVDIYKIVEAAAKGDGTKAVDNFARFGSTYPGFEYAAHKTLGGIIDMFADNHNASSNLDEVRKRRDRNAADRAGKKLVFDDEVQSAAKQAKQAEGRQAAGVKRVEAQRQQRIQDAFR